jgi:hypothetical protein
MEAALPFLGAIGGSALTGLGSYYGAQASAKAAQQAAALQQQRWNQAYGDIKPYITSGTNALNSYNTATGQNGTAGQTAWANGLSSDPGFAAATKYGLDQVSAKAAAQGQGMGGNTLAALQDYSQKNLLGYEQQTLDNLFREANMGATVGQSALGASTSSANNQGSYLTQAGGYTGQATAAPYYGASGTLNNLGSYYYGS